MVLQAWGHVLEVRACIGMPLIVNKLKKYFWKINDKPEDTAQNIHAKTDTNETQTYKAQVLEIKLTLSIHVESLTKGEKS